MKEETVESDMFSDELHGDGETSVLTTSFVNFAKGTLTDVLQHDVVLHAAEIRRCMAHALAQEGLNTWLLQSMPNSS